MSTRLSTQSICSSSSSFASARVCLTLCQVGKWAAAVFTQSFCCSKRCSSTYRAKNQLSVVCSFNPPPMRASSTSTISAPTVATDASRSRATGLCLAHKLADFFSRVSPCQLIRHLLCPKRGGPGPLSRLPSLWHLILSYRIRLRDLLQLLQFQNQPQETTKLRATSSAKVSFSKWQKDASPS